MKRARLSGNKVWIEFIVKFLKVGVGVGKRTGAGTEKPPINDGSWK